MAHYGQLIDAGEPYKENFTRLLAKFYGNPILIKIDTANGYSMYVGRIQCLLAIEKRYLIVYLPEDSQPMGTLRSLAEMNWVNLQARTLESQFPNATLIQYEPKRLPGLDVPIFLTKRENDETTYKPMGDDLPLVITMLTPKKLSYNYQDKGTIVSALETFQTILTWAN